MAIKTGDTVYVHYTGTLDDGTEFDSSEGRDPLEIVMGGNMVIPGFENAIDGREIGDTISVSIGPADAYGERNDELMIIVPRDEVPDHISPEEGMMLQITLEEGDLDVVISKVTDKEVVLDGNHPLAGKRLSFSIRVVDVKPA